MTVIQIAQRRIARRVDMLFAKNPGRYGEICVNPVTGVRYVYGVEPIEPQKKAARDALLARDKFAVVGPKDAQPLPISSEEIEDLKYAWDSKQPARDFIRSCFGDLVRVNNDDLESHPSFEEFARGVMASNTRLTSLRTTRRYAKSIRRVRSRGLGRP